MPVLGQPRHCEHRQLRDTGQWQGLLQGGPMGCAADVSTLHLVTSFEAIAVGDCVC